MGVFDGLYCATALSGENEVRWDPQQVWTDLREEKRPLSVIRLLLVGCLTRSLAECDIIIKYVPYYIVSFYCGLREEWKKKTLPLTNISFCELSKHRRHLVSLCLKANAEMVPKIPSCHYMLLM